MSRSFLKKIFLISHNKIIVYPNFYFKEKFNKPKPRKEMNELALLIFNNFFPKNLKID